MWQSIAERMCFFVLDNIHKSSHPPINYNTTAHPSSQILLYMLRTVPLIPLCSLIKSSQEYTIDVLLSFHHFAAKNDH